MILCRRTLALMAVLAAHPVALAQDPPAPPGGFAIDDVTFVNQLIQWSDGYRAMMDIRFPLHPAPANGWPGVALIHGRNGHRGKHGAFASALARRGYVTFAYDLRTEGSTPTLNPGNPGPFPPERYLLDAAECYHIAKGFVPAELDMSRLAIHGTSWGGWHAHLGAAYSGRPLPVTSYITHFPTLLAASAQIHGINWVESRVPDGVLLRYHLAEEMADSRLTPGWLAAVSGQYGVLHSILQGSLSGSIYPTLQQSTVPLISRMGYDDYRVQPGGSFDYLQTLRPGVPFKGFATGSGHGSPSNDGEGPVSRDLTSRWFDQFLKGVPNGILNEPAFTASMTHADRLAYAHPGTQRGVRHSAVWPPATPATRFYLRSGGNLSAQAPTAPEPGVLLQHRVAPGYDLASFVDLHNSGQNASGVMTAVPMVSHAFSGPVLQEEIELLGRPEVAFSVVSSTGDFQIAAALLVDDGVTPERFLVGGTAAVRGQAAGTHRLRFALRDLAVLVPAGSRLVLRIENLSHFRPPTQSIIEFVPWFSDVDIDVRISAAMPARLDLPIAPTRGIDLTPRLADATATGGFDHALTVDAGPARSGLPYFVLMSASGFGPGANYGGTWIPINPDPFIFTGVTLSNTPLFPNFAGATDTNGQATANVRLPAALATYLVGTRFTFSVLGLDNTNILAGGPAQLDIDP